ncbi:MAG: hypothetical protein JJU29_14295, partial [Verrucomicrobia bacterium]|nr:hypothetical protein [Verrucomicrobiota bacterium]
EELAYHLGGYPGDLPSDLSDDMTALQPRPDFSATLRRLGFDSAGLGVSLGFDVLSIKASSLALTVPAKIKGLLAGFFGRNAAVLAAGATAAAADGPFPVGDVIAVGGLVWTAYDLHASQGRYRRILHESLIEAVEKARTAGHEQADELSLRMHRAYEKALKALADEARK